MTELIRQVGGTHYDRAQGGEQHWDLMERYDVAYLEAVASKYPLRWREKGGLEDLRKAVTYLKKMGPRGTLRRVPTWALSNFLHASRTPPAEREIILLILDEAYGRPFDIALAITLLERMAEEETK
jgi:hypothetical protein